MNRRERTPDGMVRRIGWNAGGIVDSSVPTLQVRRPDESAIATVVGYGCHTVTDRLGRTRRTRPTIPDRCASSSAR